MRPEDPIAKHGLTGSQLDVQLVSYLSEKKNAATILRQMMDFDKLLEKHQQDSEIRLDLTVLVNHFVDLLLNFLYEGNAIAKIMGALSTQKFCLWRRTQNV